MSNFHITQGDAVMHPRAKLADFTQSLKVIANLPYNITAPGIDAV
jgi:16S rRNA A1518/A1519 N6-dimethyltransferase RsmA/KsgA/DIM1 with predicted DNA glycosylase/AP lyase activity